MRNIKPECRYCGTYVSYFGEICEDCRPAETPDQRSYREARPLCDDCGRYEATVPLQTGGTPTLCYPCTTRALGGLPAPTPSTKAQIRQWIAGVS